MNSRVLDQVTAVATLISKQRETYKPITCRSPVCTVLHNITVFRGLVFQTSQDGRILEDAQNSCAQWRKVMFQCQLREGQGRIVGLE